MSLLARKEKPNAQRNPGPPSIPSWEQPLVKSDGRLTGWWGDQGIAIHPDQCAGGPYEGSPLCHPDVFNDIGQGDSVLQAAQPPAARKGKQHIHISPPPPPFDDSRSGMPVEGADDGRRRPGRRPFAHFGGLSREPAGNIAKAFGFDVHSKLVMNAMRLGLFIRFWVHDVRDSTFHWPPHREEAIGRMMMDWLRGFTHGPNHQRWQIGGLDLEILEKASWPEASLAYTESELEWRCRTHHECPGDMKNQSGEIVLQGTSKLFPKTIPVEELKKMDYELEDSHGMVFSVIRDGGLVFYLGVDPKLQPIDQEEIDNFVAKASIDAYPVNGSVPVESEEAASRYLHDLTMEKMKENMASAPRGLRISDKIYRPNATDPEGFWGKKTLATASNDTNWNDTAPETSKSNAQEELVGANVGQDESVNQTTNLIQRSLAQVEQLGPHVMHSLVGKQSDSSDLAQHRNEFLASVTFAALLIFLAFTVLKISKRGAK